MDLLEKFAPILQFHPQERWFPSNMEKTFQYYQHNNSIANANIDYDSPQYEPVILSQVKQDPKTFKYYLQYWFYYSWNGSQCFKILRSNGEKIYFEWHPIAEHQSDFETVTLELNPEKSLITRIMVFSHGESRWRQYNSKERPWLYVALNSHAMYLREKDYSFVDKNQFFDKHIHQVMKWISNGQSKDLDIIDVVQNKHKIITNPKYDSLILGNNSSKLKLDVREHTILLIDHAILCDKNLANAWMHWKGPWGQRTYQENIKYPPPGVPDRFWSKLIIWLAIKTTLAKKFIRNVKGGKAPWWREADSSWHNIIQENESEYKNYTNIIKDLGIDDD